MILIRPSRISEHAGGARISTVLEHNGTETSLWYSVEAPWVQHLTSERQDGFLLAMLPSAMQMGEDLRVEGVVSEKFFYHLTQHFMKVLSLLYPELKPIKIVADQLERSALPRAGPGGVVSGFSGGIDSFCAFADHFLGEVPDGFRLTYCLSNNVGAHGRDDNAQGLFQSRCDRFSPLLREWNLPFIRIDSNLHLVVRARNGPFPQPGLEKTHLTRNVSAALMLQKLFTRYLYAAGIAIERCYIGPATGMGYSDPLTLHLLSTETMECVSTGSQYTRTEKTARVAELPAVQRFLDVCIKRHPGRNCSVCQKCARTLLTLEVLGKVEQFGEVFDLQKYGKVRTRHMVRALSEPDVFLAEIMELARRRNFPIPVTYRLAGLLRLHWLWPGRGALN
jgi:hypothetical protein